jgi:aspartyl-tRNA(Asn)/glutamyl-tRNA(Gln) amidotransferase subunit A
MELDELTISEVSKGLQEKKFSSSELASACLERIKAVEPKLHAFVALTEERALEQARKADFLLGSGEVRPLLGIPISIKYNFCTSGIRTTASSNVLRNFVPPYDATFVRLITEVGAISLGKTNMDAFAHGSSTETSDFGASRNLCWLLGTSVLAFDIVRLIERVFLPKPTTRAYNHYGSECIDFLLFCFC